MRQGSGRGIAVVCVGLLVGGCFGPFNLTRRLYQWNAQLQEKWEREIVFLLLAVTPVYSLTTLGDAVVFNSIEFWTGNNPVTPPATKRSAVPQTKRLALGDQEILLTRFDDPTSRIMTLEVLRDGRSESTLRFEHRPGVPTVATDAQGRVLLSAQTRADGSIVLREPSGREVASYSADDIERFFETAIR